ncbi:MAG: hypothetical protein ABWX94_01600 [Candidatus Saccharimonadales bacterium]
MTETINGPIPELNPTAVEAQPALSRAALEGVGLAAQHFYGADHHFVGQTPLGEHRLLVGLTQEDGELRNEAVGIGYNVEAALGDSLKTMRSLETVRTKSLAHIEMTETASVDFTAFAHYSPKVAPSRNAYPVPDHLEGMLAGDRAGIVTYENTVEKVGWQTEVRGLLDDYTASDPAGQKLVEDLKVSSLDHLTPEQAVKLSAAFVQNVSKYTNDSSGKPDGSRADTLTVPELLREGMDRKSDPAWEGNGVCRNIASSVKAVFESLKQTQGELSMLNNTYAVYGGGSNGAGYADKRDDGHSVSLNNSGHAWNTFVTVDSKGSAVATIIDATWALGEDANAAIEHLDRTDVRAASQIMDLFQKSERKTDAFDGLTYYTDRLLRKSSTNRRLSQIERDNLRDHSVTEYLKAAKQVDTLPDGYELPASVMAGAYRLRGQLEHQEVVTLFDLDKAGGSWEQERIKSLITGYDKNRKISVPGWKQAENLVFKDPELQELAYEAVGPERVAQLAETNGNFRMRLRQQHPGELPAFDPYTRQADAQELSHIASQSGIREKDPKAIVRSMTRSIKQLAGNDAVAEAIVAGRSEYDLATNFQAIIGALRKQ